MIAYSRFIQGLCVQKMIFWGLMRNAYAQAGYARKMTKRGQIGQNKAKKTDFWVILANFPTIVVVPFAS